MPLNLTSGLLTLALASTVLAGPPPTKEPGTVATSVQQVPLPVARPGDARGEVLRARLPTTRTRIFTTLGVTWRTLPRDTTILVRVRARSVGGVWSSWQTLPRAPVRTDPAATTATRGGTAPLYVGQSDAVQVRADVTGGAAPPDLRVDLVDAGQAAADASLPAPTMPGPGRAPRVITRAEWGAEPLRNCHPRPTGPPRVAFVASTAAAASYRAEEAASVVRGISAYHVRSLGWCDLGYSYLVDRFGRPFAGRATGGAVNVPGAHTEGFSADSTGVALLGSPGQQAPPVRQLQTVAQLLAHELHPSYVDPRGTVVLSAGAGSRTLSEQRSRSRS
jgi:hypothetical protein